MEAVEGYRFTDLEMAKKAQKEAEGVRYIKERVNENEKMDEICCFIDGRCSVYVWLRQ